MANSAATLAPCLRAVLAALPPGAEVIVVDDGSTDGSYEIARGFPVRRVRLAETRGAAHARNVGIAYARAPLCFFLDSDIVVRPDTLALALRIMTEDPGLAGLFGSYGPETPHLNIFSQYKNLIHHYTHQTSSDYPGTFCSGFGAIRKNVFRQLGGFDGYRRRLEDIELGYRLYLAGYRVRLVKEMQVTHLKRYTLLSLVKSDLLGRAVPWTELMLRYKIFRFDLNLKPHNALSAIVALGLLFALPAAFLVEACCLALPLLLICFFWLNRKFFDFVLETGGLSLMLSVIALSWLTYLLSVLGAAIGAFQWARKAAIVGWASARAE